MTICAYPETCRSLVVRDEASGRKKVDFMMDGSQKRESLADKLEFSCKDYELSLDSFSLILVRYAKVLIDSELPG